MPAPSPTDIVNRAIQIVGNNQEPVTGNYPTFDGSASGITAATLYDSAVQTVARQWGYDFSRGIAALNLTGNAPPVGYTYEYAYPTNGIEVRQLLPPALADANDPLPINWVVGNNSVAGAPTKVIWTDQATASAYFTNTPPPALWDALFTESVVRLLASEMAMANAGRPDTARDTLQQSGDFAQVGSQRDS